MKKRNYWLNLFTGATWEQFIESGGNVSGFRASRWKTVRKIKVGDYLLCYLTGISRFIGVLEVIDEPYQDSAPIWTDEAFPSRLKVKSILDVSVENAIPVQELKEKLSMFQGIKNPHAWTGRFRGSPTEFSMEDGKAVLAALIDAKENPVARPYDKKKLAYRPRAMKANIGSVTVPETQESNGSETLIQGPTLHTEIQWHLLKLGSDMRFHVWVARNDRNKDYNGKKFSSLSKLKSNLPLQFDEATNRTIEFIDVLWLQNNTIVAAFEIESTTSIYSGLLRMSDLVAMQPNLNIPLYLVAPEDRREKVLAEVNRPTFSRLSPPLSEICRFISFSGLKDQIKQAAPYIRFMKPEFLDELSESCEIEEV